MSWIGIGLSLGGGIGRLLTRLRRETGGAVSVLALETPWRPRLSRAGDGSVIVE